MKARDEIGQVDDNATKVLLDGTLTTSQKEMRVARETVDVVRDEKAHPSWRGREMLRRGIDRRAMASRIGSMVIEFDGRRLQKKNLRGISPFLCAAVKLRGRIQTIMTRIGKLT